MKALSLFAFASALFVSSSAFSRLDDRDDRKICIDEETLRYAASYKMADDAYTARTAACRKLAEGGDQGSASVCFRAATLTRANHYANAERDLSLALAQCAQ